MRRKRGAGAGILLFFFLMAVSFVPVLADTGQTGDGQEEEDMTLMIDDSLLSQMDLQEVQRRWILCWEEQVFPYLIRSGGWPTGRMFFLEQA